jgi:hypothetical protein
LWAWRIACAWLFEPPEMLAERGEGADSEFWERSAFADAQDEVRGSRRVTPILCICHSIELYPC